MYLTRLGSRREINHQLRGNVRCAAKFRALFGIEQVPHGDTVNYSCKRVDTAEVQEVMCGMVESLIRKKVLYAYRLFNRYYMVAIDGTGELTFQDRHCEHCLTRQLNNGATLYYHPVLEAKLVTANGFCFSLMTEFIENSDPSADKQDCELKAFYRLAERLKKRFPRLPICLLLDGLFIGGPVFSICGKNGWKYLITLKDKDLPSINEEFRSLCKLEPDKEVRWKFHEGGQAVAQRLRWQNDLSYKDTFRNEHTLSVLECREIRIDKKEEKSTKTYRWVTNFQVNEQRLIPLANGGRNRWKIENEGFNDQKNGGYELEHPYSEDENARKVFYLLLQMAHMIFQLIQRGSLFKKAFPNGVGSAKNIAKRLLEAWRNLTIKISHFDKLTEGKFQIRLDSS